MTMAAPVTQGHSADIARVAFSMFVYVADVEKDISPQEVRRFQALLNETSWVENDDLRVGLAELRDKYSSFWAHYEDGILAADTSSIAESLDRARGHLGEDRSRDLLRELHRFLEQLDRGPYGAKLIQNDQNARAVARKEVLKVLSLEGERPLPFANEVDSQSVDPAPKLPTITVLKERATNTSIEVPMPSESLWPAAMLTPAKTEVWASGKTKVRCVSVAAETHDTKTYTFVTVPQKLFHYKPGQFVTIEIALDNTILRRSYTVSSSPSRPYTLSITVKKVPMGWMSNWLFDNMAEGVECVVSGPAGKFTCIDHPSEKLLFLAAGSGVTPPMSMLRWLADTSSKADVVFINNVRTPDDIIFHQELLHLNARLGESLRLMIVPAAVSAGRPWNGPIGRLDETLLRFCVPDFVQRETFVCGPPGYMSAAKAMLRSAGLPAERYHDESFGAARPAVAPQPQSPPTTGSANGARSTSVGGIIPATLPSAGAEVAAPAAILPGPRPVQSPTKDAPTDAGAAGQKSALPVILSPKFGGPATQPSAPVLPSSLVPVSSRSVSTAPPVAPRSGFKVTIQETGANFVARPGQTILEAAEEAGVALEYSCRSGVCGSCKMRKVSGHARMDQSVLSEADIGVGNILTCIGRAVGDVTLCGALQ